MRIHLGHVLALGLVTGLGPDAAAPAASSSHPAAPVAPHAGGETPRPYGADRFTRPADSIAAGLSGSGVVRGGENRYQFGGHVVATTGADQHPAGEWTHHQQHGPAGHFIFESAPSPGTGIRQIVCDAAHAAEAGTASRGRTRFAGIGTFRHVRSSAPQLAPLVAGASHHWFEVEVEDPGTCQDRYRITIYAGVAPGEAPNTTDVIYTAGGRMDGGELRVSAPAPR